MAQRTYEMYTDGSYNTASGIYSGAYAVKNLLEDSVTGSNPEFATARNVAGECLAVIQGIKALIVKENLIPGDKILICHDYTGLAEWAEGNWQARKPVAKKYVAAINFYRNDGLLLEFRKVPAHSGIPENEHVDKLAKKAAGII
jgi:ribonuclease HI